MGSRLASWRRLLIRTSSACPGLVGGPCRCAGVRAVLCGLLRIRRVVALVAVGVVALVLLRRALVLVLRPLPEPSLSFSPAASPLSLSCAGCPCRGRSPGHPCRPPRVALVLGLIAGARPSPWPELPPWPAKFDADALVGAGRRERQQRIFRPRPRQQGADHQQRDDQAAAGRQPRGGHRGRHLQPPLAQIAAQAQEARRQQQARGRCRRRRPSARRRTAAVPSPRRESTPRPVRTAAAPPARSRSPRPPSTRRFFRPSR